MPKPTEMKSFTLRLPAPLADELATVAEVDSVPVQQAVRDAIAAHIEARRTDKAFQERLRASAERHREILERLAR
jgi:predicted transcriptional regulator